MQKVFTTGQVARICRVAPRTVSKWIDSGKLHGYRIPGSNDRRVVIEHLIPFLKDHGMPLGELAEEGWHKVLIVGADQAFLDRVRELLPPDDEYVIEAATSGFEAGVLAESFRPDTVVIDLAMGRAQCLEIARNLRRNPANKRTVLLALACEDETDPAALAEAGFNDVFRKPFDVALLAERIQFSAMLLGTQGVRGVPVRRQGRGIKLRKRMEG